MNRLIPFVLSAALCGCASVGGVAPQSVDEALGAAQLQVAGLEQSAAQALASGLIRKEDAQFILGLADQATAAISAAKVAEGAGDLSTAQAQLAVATSLLTQLAAYLASHGVK